MNIVKQFKNKYILLVLFTYIIYLIYIISLFPTNCFNSALSQVDYTWHFTDMVSSTHFFNENYRIWGYDPYHSAGTTVGIALGISNHWALMLNIVLGRILAPERVFNLSILIALLLLPILAFLTARNFGLKEMNSFLFFVLAIVLIRVVSVQQLIYWGLYGFILGTFFSFYTVSLLFAYLHDKSAKRLIILTLIASLTFFIHPLTLITCLILSIPLCLFYCKKINRSDFLKLACSGIFAIFVNMIWIVPQIRFSQYIKGTWHYLQTDGNLAILSNDATIALLTTLFIFSLYSLMRNKEHRFVKTVCTSFILFLVITFFGSQLGLSNYEPARFIVPFYLVLMLPIAKAFSLERRNIGFIILLIIIMCTALQLPLKFSCGFPPQSNELLSFIKINMTQNARLQVEESVDQAPYFNTLFMGYIPYATSRQILAASYRYPADAFIFTQFVGNDIFGNKLRSISDSEFKQYLDLYNLKYFLIYSQNARDFFDNRTDFKRIFSINWASNEFTIYQYLDAVENFCYDCNASIHSDYDLITVDNATSNVTVLKYHYYDVLKVKPDTITIKPIMLLNDPIPFIHVENNAQTNFTIYVD